MPYKDKEKEREHKKQYYQEHREEILAKMKKHYQEHRVEKKQYRQEHRDEISFYNKQYWKEYRDELLAKRKQYWKEHKEEWIAACKQYRQKHPDKMRGLAKKARNKRKRNLGFIPLNKPFENSDAHHICATFVIYIPKEIHQSIRHSVLRNRNMDEINAVAWNYLMESRV